MNFNFNQPNLISNLGEALSTQRQVVSSSTVPFEAPTAKPKKGLKPLPQDFTPTGYSVILGRGKGSYNYVGNKRCRVIVKSFLDDFYGRETRSERAVTVSKVISVIRKAAPIGAFVKLDGGLWHEVSDKIAREKIFTMFRDVRDAECREALRASSSSPEKVTSKALRRASMPAKPDTMKSTSFPALQQDSLKDLFQPIMFTDIDDNSLGESLAESLGSKLFYDIDSCSLCTI